MIIQERGDHLILIRQTDHAVLSGYFARELGNESFARSEPEESLRLAATEHDNGWNEWELQPHIDQVTFLPFTFMSLPTQQHMDLYQRGIERVVKVDRYAGLLVSMHCAGLYDKTRATMPGFSAKYVKSQEAPLVTDFVQRLRLQQLRLKVDLRADPAMKNGCRPMRSAWRRWIDSPCTFVWGPWKRLPLTPYPPTIMVAKWIGIYSLRGITRRRWNRTLSAAIRWKSAYWHGEFQSDATRIIWNFRKCWRSPPISGRNTPCGPEVHECGRGSPPAPERVTPAACVCLNRVLVMFWVKFRDEWRARCLPRCARLPALIQAGLA